MELPNQSISLQHVITEIAKKRGEIQDLVNRKLDIEDQIEKHPDNYEQLSGMLLSVVNEIICVKLDIKALLESIQPPSGNVTLTRSPAGGE